MKKTISIIVVLGFLIVSNNAFASCIEISTDLSLGSTDSNTNGNVTQLQNSLKELGYFTATPNGVFGPATLKSVQKFQIAQNLSGTGFVGPLTRAALKSRKCNDVVIREVPEKTFDIVRPKQGQEIPLGKNYTIRWRTEMKSTYSIILENEQGVSQGYITASRIGGTEFEWRAGSVFSTETQRDIVVPSGKYKIRIRNTYTGNSDTDPQSAVFTLTNPLTQTTFIYPSEISYGKETPLVLYGIGFNDMTSVYIDGSFNIRTKRDYVSPDGSILVFTVPQNLTQGTHSIFVYNGYESVQSPLVFSVK